MDNATYTAHVLSLRSGIDDRHTVSSWQGDFASFIAYSKMIDFAKRQAFYGKKPTREKLAGLMDGVKNAHDSQIGELNDIDLGSQKHDPDIIHAIIGMATEAGEMLELMTEYLRNPNGEINLVNAIEELGDMQWYLYLFLSAVNKSANTQLDMTDVLQANINKLSQRYKDKSAQSFGKERDLASEADAIKKVTNA